MSFRSKWWLFKAKMRVRWHKLLCKRGKHEWRLTKTVVGHHIGGRYYNRCLWCGKEDWDMVIDKEHQK